MCEVVQLLVAWATVSHNSPPLCVRVQVRICDPHASLVTHKGYCLSLLIKGCHLNTLFITIFVGSPVLMITSALSTQPSNPYQSKS